MSTYNVAYYDAVLKRYLHEEMAREGLHPDEPMSSIAKREIAFRVYQRLMSGEMDADVRKEVGDSNE